MTLAPAVCSQLLSHVSTCSPARHLFTVDILIDPYSRDVYFGIDTIRRRPARRTVPPGDTTSTCLVTGGAQRLLTQDNPLFILRLLNPVHNQDKEVHPGIDLPAGYQRDHEMSGLTGTCVNRFNNWSVNTSLPLDVTTHVLHSASAIDSLILGLFRSFSTHFGQARIYAFNACSEWQHD